MEKASASPSAAPSTETEKAKKDVDGKNIVCEPDEPVINYRGIYAMPFIMGIQYILKSNFQSFSVEESFNIVSQ